MTGLSAASKKGWRSRKRRAAALARMWDRWVTFPSQCGDTGFVGQASSETGAVKLLFADGSVLYMPAPAFEIFECMSARRHARRAADHEADDRT